MNVFTISAAQGSECGSTFSAIFPIDLDMEETTWQLSLQIITVEPGVIGNLLITIHYLEKNN